MKSVNAIHRLAAAAIAVLATTATVWGIANLGYPAAGPVLLAAKHARAGS